MKRLSNWPRWSWVEAAKVSTVAQALATAQSRGVDRLDAQLLLLHVLGKPAHDRAWLLAHDTDALPPAGQAAMDVCVQRRAAGVPLPYITGHKEFFGLDLQVDARVLVPRPDTETLVEWALEVLAELPGAAVIDLGTGSGAIALALKTTRPDLQLTAVDASADALQVAQANARRLQLPVEFMQGSWLTDVSGRYHAIVSNPPYVAAADPHLDALTHEPLQALASGDDGLDDIRQIVSQAQAHLSPGGWLLLEHGYDQAAAVRALLLDAGFENVQSRQDLNGIERCSGGRAPAA
ncbi:MAG: peptide chain release factor N(5)-glutamine methyltransferase [Rhodoferax sp.]|uniref:peptide chain release factor N(5)-glutamine methyltransferase n=1 Tax=Rhodoferax sp. TaxID=50421 RepID=UPI0027235A5C|nr:peptide chain release factor N(5)-glutamine methyltransferase [Rhodoferax sp.]MDO8448878.1 peptide chain release factor N(5)-glutamine methyltransferase [Rhodoferax sp.]